MFLTFVVSNPVDGDAKAPGFVHVEQGHKSQSE